MKTIDITPTWSAVLPILLHIARNGTDQNAMREIEKEFRRMAELADKWVEYCKSQTPSE